MRFFSMVKELKKNARTITQYNFTVMEIVSHLYRFCGNNYLNFEDHTGEIRNVYEEILKMDETTLSAWLVRVAISISDELKNARTSSLRSLIAEAKKYSQGLLCRYRSVSGHSMFKAWSIEFLFFLSIQEGIRDFIHYLSDRLQDAAGCQAYS